VIIAPGDPAKHFHEGGNDERHECAHANSSLD
jgi:hypothetical protein